MIAQPFQQQENENLVGGIPTPLKNMSSSMGRIIPYIMENKKCSKTPTRSLSENKVYTANVMVMLDHCFGRFVMVIKGGPIHC
jgi:hypothetical protein